MRLGMLAFDHVQRCQWTLIQMISADCIPSMRLGKEEWFFFDRSKRSQSEAFEDDDAVPGKV